MASWALADMVEIILFDMVVDIGFMIIMRILIQFCIL